MTIPNRTITPAERDQWIVNYHARGGVNRFELELLYLVNLERENAGVEPLAANPTLMLSARFKAQSMLDLNYFGFNPHYGSLSNIIRQLFEYDGGIISGAEQFMRWYPTAQIVIDRWMNIPAHRENILDPHFVEIGIGAVNTRTGNGSFSNFWTMILVETEAGVVNPPNIPQSQIQLPNRRLTQDELNQWIAEYHNMGGINEFEQEVLRLTNIERTRAGLAPLNLNPRLMMSARFKAQIMADQNYFAHENPIYGHFTNISRELFGTRVMGENIAIWQRTPEDVVAAFMNSPGHRAAILNPDFTELGVGFFRDRWVQKFGDAQTPR